MNEIKHHSAALIAFMQLFFSVNSPAAITARWTVANQPARLVNGSPVLFRVTTPKGVHSLSGKWLGHEIAFNFDASHKSWFALAGAGQETKPGDYPLELQAETAAGQAVSFEKKIRVQRQRYPRVLVPLKVPAPYTAPSPEEQRQIEQDKETKTEVFKTVTAEREWKGSFTPPVNAEISDVFRSRAHLQRLGAEHASGARFPRAQWNLSRSREFRTSNPGAVPVL